MTTVETIYRLLANIEYVQLVNTNTNQTEYCGLANNIPLELLNCEVQQLIGGMHTNEKDSRLWDAHIIMYIVKE